MTAHSTPRRPPAALAFIVTVVLLSGAHDARAADVRVTNTDTLRAAMKQAKPGTRVLLAPGTYAKAVIGGLKGTPEQPIIIESADPSRPAVFAGGANLGLMVSKASHLVLRNFRVERAAVNGLNVDDGGDNDDPSHHIVLENITVTDIGGGGNNDAIKLSGLVDFTVRNCTAEGWGGSAIDMVGCHRGLIENCTFRGKPGMGQASGVQMKGGSTGLTVRNCTFIDVTGRAVNIGGNTDRRYFRPLDAKYEAKDLTVEGCRFIGSDAPIAFVGSENCLVRYNTIYEPKKWALRILQENTTPGFIPCRNGRFENNVVVYSAGTLRSVVNVGDGTKPETFTFAGNLWHARDNPSRSRPKLPTNERAGIYDVDPKPKDPAGGDLSLTAAPRGVGAEAIRSGSKTGQ